MSIHEKRCEFLYSTSTSPGVIYKRRTAWLPVNSFRVGTLLPSILALLSIDGCGRWLYSHSFAVVDYEF